MVPGHYDNSCLASGRSGRDKHNAVVPHLSVVGAGLRPAVAPLDLRNWWCSRSSDTVRSWWHLSVLYL